MASPAENKRRDQERDHWRLFLLSKPSLGTIQQVFEEWLHPVASEVTATVFRTAYRRPTLGFIAREHGVCSRTLKRRFRAAGLFEPHRLVVLARWIPVASMLSAEAYTATQVAQAFGFPTARAMYKDAPREIRLTIPQLRDPIVLGRILGDLMAAYQRGFAELQAAYAMMKLSHLG